MESVTFSGDPAVSARREAAAVPCWWRQPHSFALAAMAAGHIGFLGGTSLWRDSLDFARYVPRYDDAIAGILFAECYLLGLWAALGGLRAIPRWLTVSGTLGTGLVLYVRANATGDEFWEQVVGIGLVAAMLATAFAVLLVPLRGLAGWRVDFDPAYYRHVTRRRGQVGFMELAAYSCCIAVPLTAMRLLADGAEGISMEDMPIVFAALGLTAATAVPISYALLVWRRLWLAAPFAIASPIAVAWAHTWLGAVVDDLNFLGSSATLLGLSLPLFAFHAGIAATVFGSLLILRCFGLRLIAVGKL